MATLLKLYMEKKKNKVPEAEMQLMTKKLAEVCALPKMGDTDRDATKKEMKLQQRLLK